MVQDIESSPLALSTFHELVANGQPEAAVRFVRDSGYTVAPHLVPAPHLDTAERYRAEGKRTAGTRYEAIHAREIEAERSARVLAQELASMGNPTVAEAPIGTPHLARLAEMRSAGQHAAADIYEAIHGKAISRERAERDDQIERTEEARLVGCASPLAGLTIAEKIARINSGRSGLSDDDAIAALRRLGAEGDARLYKRHW
jgi:hypothetical protein